MTQQDFGTINPADKSGTQLAVDLNAWRDSVHSSHRGSTQPAYRVAGMLWVDDSADPVWALKVHDGEQWIELARFNAATHDLATDDTSSRFQTGDYKERHGTGTHPGWVRANGLTIGSASSGATERANADCQNLFEHLWNQDATLSVSGGRGGSATSDWAANKAITLPDRRLRTAIGMASMGNAASTIIPASAFDNGENGNTLGATVGAGAVALTVDQLAVHNHTGTALQAGNHSHGFVGPADASALWQGQNQNVGVRHVTNRTTDSAGAHTHNLSINSAGGGQPHPNVQPSMAVHIYIKL